jgi:hypothetical protein
VLREHGVLRAGTALLRKPFTPSALLRRVAELLSTTGGR